MATTQKAIALARDLKEKLAFRLPKTWVIVESFDSDGNPVLAFQQDSSWAAGEQKLVIRVKPVAPLAEAKDGLGLAQRQFAPHVIQVAGELTAVANIGVPQPRYLGPVLMELALRGTRVEYFHSANTNDPDPADMTGVPVFAFDPDIYNPVTNQI